MFFFFQERDGRFEEFQNGAVNILVCTDIASRGLDTLRVRGTIETRDVGNIEQSSAACYKI